MYSINVLDLVRYLLPSPDILVHIIRVGRSRSFNSYLEMDREYPSLGCIRRDVSRLSVIFH